MKNLKIIIVYWYDYFSGEANRWNIAVVVGIIYSFYPHYIIISTDFLF